MDERRPSRSHHGLITDKAWRVIECSLAALEEASVPYVLVGGWAAAAYGSPIPSVDTDIYLHRADREMVSRLVAERCGFTVNKSDTLELLDGDAPTSVLSFDLDLDGLDLRFEPGRLFVERPPVRREAMVAGRDLGAAMVPDLATLLFLKLCAWRARRFRWQAYRDPRVLARMDPSDKSATFAKTAMHWERKAGKDLYDAAWLVATGGDPAEALKIAQSWGIDGALIEALTDVPQALVEYAYDLVRDFGILPEVEAGVEALLRVAADPSH